MNPWAEPGRKEFSDGNSRASSDVHLKILFYQLRWTWILSLKKKSSFWRRKTALACLIKSYPGCLTLKKVDSQSQQLCFKKKKKNVIYIMTA